ncbi:alkaline phosphatase D family protein [Micromonospora carbonacea]|uniref:alkaline phosphatase D family protein n=1 Tax=Micromonospora carbonacea TaxID=47853 RepID=UPI00340AAB10
MTVVWMMVGAVTSSSAVFSARVTGGPVRVGVSTSPSFTSPAWSASTTVDSTGVAKVSFTGLAAGTRYWWRVEDNGTVDATYTGQLRTDPVAAGQPASYVLGCIGDAGLTPTVPGVTGAATQRLSNHPIFDTVRTKALAENWARVAHLGDVCYYDLGSGNHGLSATASAAQYRSMWDDVLAQPRQHQLYREVPWVYVWDDHDFGPDNSNASSPGAANALSVYRERIPSYPLPGGAGQPVYHSFQIGRVLHIVSDTRSARVPGSTMLGAAQLAWLSNLLATSTAEALVWLMPTPWLGISSDTWAGFPTERNSIVSMLTAGGWTDRMVMINADAHTLAIDSGKGGNAGSGGFPVVLCAGLDATPHSYSTQYDSGAWPGREQYATVQVDDTGSDIALTTTVYRRERAISWVSVTTGGTTRVPAGSPCHVLAL